MKLINLELSKLSDGKKYHVYYLDAHTYYAATYNAKKSVFETIPNYDSPMEQFRPKTIPVLGAELILDEDKYKKACPTYKVVEG